jgi:8-amino-7-oxononanoate synthase
LVQLRAELSAELAALAQRGLLRRVRRVDAVRGASVRIGGRSVVCWCSNDDLGLSAHPAVTQAAASAATQWGVGARASRLLAGTTACHEQLEAALASWYGAEDAVVFASGYRANLGTLGALGGPKDTILIDRLAHASLVDAARATRAKLRVFRHNEVGHVRRLLAAGQGPGRRLIVTEGLFSMDGDAAPLRELVEVAEAFGALVYVDDAHGAFVRGRRGRGSCEAEGVALERVVYMATLGKALGSQGGVVVGPGTLTSVLRNRARTFIYSTGLSVPAAAAAMAALEVADREPERRQRLWEHSAELARLLAEAGCGPLPRDASHIVPVMLGSAARAMEVGAGLWRAGIWAPAIRPPTVPQGTSRLRLSLTADHTREHLRHLAKVLGTWVQ